MAPAAGSRKQGWYQQNLSARKLAVVVLGNSQWPDIRLCLKPIAATLNSTTPGC
jgi:hypothetical protein